MTAKSQDISLYSRISYGDFLDSRSWGWAPDQTLSFFSRGACVLLSILSLT
jgi:hypothetical protein